MQVERGFVARRFWLKWMFLSAIGLCVGLVVGVPLTIGLAVGMMLFLPVIGSVIGTSLGVMQWLALRRISQIVWWTLASAVGVAIGLTLGTTLIEVLGLTKGKTLDEMLGITVIGAVTGASLGVMQWVVLRRVGSKTWWWILANTVGMGAGFLTGGLMAEAFIGSLRTPAALAVLVAVSGLAAGAITGFALPRLIPQPATET